MSEPLSVERLRQMRADTEGVTPGPWEAREEDWRVDVYTKAWAHMNRINYAPSKADAKHIANYPPETARALIDEVLAWRAAGSADAELNAALLAERDAHREQVQNALRRIEELEAERDALQKTHDESAVVIESLRIAFDGLAEDRNALRAELEKITADPMLPMLLEFARRAGEVVGETGARNYVTCNIQDADGKVVAWVTLQAADGKSPAELKDEAEAERDALQARIKAARDYYLSDKWISDDNPNVVGDDEYERALYGVLAALCGGEHVDDSYGQCAYCREAV